MVLNMVRVTDALPILSAVVSYDMVRYTPEVLLDASSLPADIVDHSAFACECRVGYDTYFESLYIEGEQDNELFEYRPCDCAVILNVIHENVVSSHTSCLPADVGFAFGWLSALARYQPVDAEVGVQVLSSLVTSISHCRSAVSVPRGCSLSSRSVGLDGWPLDM